MASCFSEESSINNICLICLDENPDTIPPCKGVLFPLFHRKCLDMSNYGKSSLKCPHCNKLYSTEVTDDDISIKLDTLKHKVQGVMEKWLQDRSYWVKGPEYIPVERSLMNPNEVSSILGSICQIVCQQMAQLSSATIYCVHPPPPDEDAIVYRHRDSETGIETDVILRRTAILKNNAGSFQMDGFTISMSRSRYSRRCFRAAVSFLEKKDFSGLTIDF
jgi:hypothetical protein